MPTNEQDVPGARTDALQFDAVVHADPRAATATCDQCKKPIADQYYAAGRAVLCESCKRTVEQTLLAPASAAGTARAVLFGLVAAVLGAAIYLGVLATGWEIAIVAILVGWMVGWAVKRGARTGGRRFQVIAVALTYLAIATAYMPVAISMLDEQKTGKPTSDSSKVSTDSTTNSRAPVQVPVMTATQRATAPDEKKRSEGVGMLALYVLVAAIASPIIVIKSSFPSSILTLIIIGVGLRQAWRMNARSAVKFTGPFKVGSGPAAAAASA